MWWLAACAPHAAYEGEVAADGLPRGTPAPEAAARYAAASAWSLEHGGQDLVVVEGDEVVFEAHAPGYDPARGHHLFSGTKSFACLLVQSAIGRGLVSSLDEPVGDAFPAILDPADPRRATITVRHLLTFRAACRTTPLG